MRGPLTGAPKNPYENTEPRKGEGDGEDRELRQADRWEVEGKTAEAPASFL